MSNPIRDLSFHLRNARSPKALPLFPSHPSLLCMEPERGTSQNVYARTSLDRESEIDTYKDMTTACHPEMLHS